MSRIRPQVVITFGLHGHTSHLDHVAVGWATLAAFLRVQQAGEEHTNDDLGACDRLLPGVWRSLVSTKLVTNLCRRPLGGLVPFLGLAGAALNTSATLSTGLAGVLMAAFSAASFAVVMVLGSPLMRSVPPMVLNLYVAWANTALFAVVGVLVAGLTWPAVAMGWLGLAGAALFFVLGLLGLFVGVAMIGPSRAACLTNVEPVVTIALAITVLDEPFGVWQFTGAAAVLIGIFTMCRNMLTESEEEGER